MNPMEALVKKITRDPAAAGRMVHYRYLPSVPAKYRKLELPESLQKVLIGAGIKKLYSHQADAVKALRQGRHTCIATPTASGKTMIYNLAVTEKLLAEPDSRALYLFPLKALAQDQLQTLQTFFKQTGQPGLTAAIYDGDTSASARARIRRAPPRVLLTNPDMLHYGMLAHAELWQDFYRTLRFIVVDEAHTYRGMFGSHVALIMRRLLRMCRAASGGPGPVLIASSATMANSREFLNALAGREFNIIDKSGAPRPGRHVLLVEPQTSPYTEAAEILQDCVERNIKTIVFTKSRKITELIQIWVRKALPAAARKIAAYRSGYLPEERREIERRLFKDELSAVISTSALEAGIDVGGLDACILVGYPGTMISTWQRVGRAGRGARDSLMVLIALPDALDYYFIRHPEVFFSSAFENCVLDPENRPALRQHLLCAAQERPLTRADLDLFGAAAAQVIPELVKSGELREAAAGGAWHCGRKAPHRNMDIRGAGQGYAILTEAPEAHLGSIDDSRVFKECHPGAVYLHAGLQYEVTRLDFEARRVYVQETDADWYTQYTSSEEIEILNLPEGKILGAADDIFRAGLVPVRVTEKVVAYERRRVADRSLLSEHKLTLPPRVFETQAVLLLVPENLRRRAQEFKLDFSGGLHAAEHALIGALPLQVVCDRWDLGGLSALAHPQTRQSGIFIYDGYPGGVGLAAKGLEGLAAWLAATRDLVQACACEDGCPACIHSPKCGSQNRPLDKAASLMILNAALVGKVRPLALPPPSGAVAARPGENALPSAAAPRAVSREYKFMVFDLETRRSAAEVGGWENADRMGLSLGVVYDHAARGFTAYREEQVQDLIQHLLSADTVVGFNCDSFDLRVLSHYSPHARSIRTLDMLSAVRQKLGHRLSLDQLAKTTLGRGKTADGLQAIAWWQQGCWEELEKYCRADVAVTRDLFFFGWRYGYLLFENQATVLKIPVEWQAQFPQLDLTKAADQPEA